MKGKHSSLSKVLLLVAAFVLVIGMTVVGTLAWLTSQSEIVTNTFTSAELFANPSTDFTLWEHKADDTDGDGRYILLTGEGNEVKQNTYDILPGVNIPKDPTVDIVNLEEYAYLYIRVTGAIPGVTYSIDSANWTQLTGYTDVWVYSGSNAENNVIKASDDAKKTFTVNILTQNLDGTAITVPSEYTNTTDNSTLTFNAYMAQATGNGENAVDAWKNTFNVGTELVTP